METNSTENNEINLYDDLLKFNQLSPEERLSAAEAPTVEQQAEIGTDETVESFKESNGASGALRLAVSETVEQVGEVETTESSEMIFTLSETEAQTTGVSAGDDSAGFVLSYQDQLSDESAEGASFSAFVEETQHTETNTQEQTEPLASSRGEEPQSTFLKTSDLVPQSLDARIEEPKNFLTESKNAIATENVIEATHPAAARETDKQGVRITVREETAGSVTLSVADILGEDDFDDEEPVNQQPVTSQIIESQPADTSAAQPEIASPKSEPTVESGPLAITDFLVEPAIDPSAVEDASVASETPVTQSFDHLPETPTAADQPAQDSGRLEEMLKGSKPLKITGFLNDQIKLDNVSDPTEVICPACGHVSKSTDLLCLECGAFFDDQEIEVQSLSVCTDCGEMVAADEVFCPACGSILLAH